MSTTFRQMILTFTGEALRVSQARQGFSRLWVTLMI